MYAQGVQVVAAGTVQVDAPLIAKTHAAMGVLDAMQNALTGAAGRATLGVLVRRRRIPWINQRLRTRETW